MTGVRTWLVTMWKGSDPPERNPTVLFLVLYIAISTAPTAFGLTALPGSLVGPPDIFGQGVASAMFAGAAATTLGIMLPKRDAGLPWEMGGKILLGFSSAVYCVALLLNGVGNVALATGMSGGLALGCLARSVQIGLYVHGRARRGRALRACPRRSSDSTPD